MAKKPGWILFSAAVLSLIMASSLIGTALTSQGYIWIRTVSMLVPAVAETPEGYIGVSSKLIVSVAYPGHGVVYFAAEPLTQLDTQAAARIAALVASILAGTSFYSYDYFIHLKANSTIIGGPSASGAMAVAILAALRSRSIPATFSMTGMVDPDTTLGPVGGIPEKLQAMAKSGVKVFVIPAGQEIALDLNTGRYVNVTALGESLGVKVVAADTILDAYVEATGDTELLYHLEASSKKLANIYEEVPSLKENMLTAISFFSEKAQTNLTCAEKLIANLDHAIKNYVGKLVDEAKSLLAEEKSIQKRGLIYSAASRAFGAAIDATIACIASKAFSVANSTKTLNALRSATKNYTASALNILGGVEKSLKDLLSGDNVTTLELQIAIAIENRIEGAHAAVDAANHYLSIASQSTGFNQVEALLGALQDAVYAYYRSLTAKQWLSLAESTKTLGEAPIETLRIASIAEDYYHIALSASTYLQALAASTGIAVSPPPQLDEARKIISRGVSPRNVTAALDILALSISALADIASSIHKVFNTNTEKTLMASHKALTILIELNTAYNITPLLPSLYQEYASIQQDIDTRLALYMQAASYSILLSILAKHPQEATQPPQTPGGTPLTVTKTIRTTKVEKLTKTVTETSTTTIKEIVTIREARTMISTITSTTTAIKTRPLTDYAPLILIALVIGAAIGYVVGRSRPL